MHKALKVQEFPAHHLPPDATHAGNGGLAMQMNPFVKYRGLEVFGVVERAKGQASTEVTERTWNQYAVDTVYRFLPGEKMFAGVRYNKAEGALPDVINDVSAKRWQIGGG